LSKINNANHMDLMGVTESQSIPKAPQPSDFPQKATYWRVEGSLLNLNAVRPVGFFTWNSQGFSERWLRRGGLALLALIRPFLFSVDRIFATRVLHTLLRGISRDRLDLLGEEFFNYYLKPKLKAQGVQELKEAITRGERIVLVSQGLEHVMRPLAKFLGVEYLIANRLEFRDGLATGRLLSPVIRPRQVLARIIGRNPDGRVPLKKLSRNLGHPHHPRTLIDAILPSKRTPDYFYAPTVVFDKRLDNAELSVHQSLAGKNVLLIGFTGFIAKVWLAKALSDLPEIGKIYLLIRRQRSVSGLRRFEKVIEESPLFEEFHERYGAELGKYLNEKIEVVEGDISQENLGIEPAALARMRTDLDLIVNSSGLTDFNPDLRQALSINVEGAIRMLDFQRACNHAALLHLSTCYVVGFHDGRIIETPAPNYTPSGKTDFNAEREYLSLQELVREVETRSESDEVTKLLQRQVLDKPSNQGKKLGETELNAQTRKQRQRWVKNELIQVGMERARQYGWPNTYTFTKSLAESLIAIHGYDLPIAIVRPSIVETSTHDPFEGWNEGVNTSAPISYLLGTFFRQMPTNRKKCLDIIPVDLVCRGMFLISAALVKGRHERIYHLATSATNPCDMRRTIELTGLAHRKHYRAQDEFNQRLLAYFDTIPVSKERYQNLSAPMQKQLVQALQRILSPLPMAKSPLVRRERDLDKVAKIIELYEPFILYNEYLFEARNVEILSIALPAEERDRFGYDASRIDWWDYWINIHIPALRKWSYPLIEGKPIENKTRRPIQLQPQEHTIATG
jgi:hypothetical protein